MVAFLPFAPSNDNKRSKESGCSVSIWFLLLSNLLVFQLTQFYNVSSSPTSLLFQSAMPVPDEHLQIKYIESLALPKDSNFAATPNTTTSAGWNPHDPMAIPVGQPENLYVVERFACAFQSWPFIHAYDTDASFFFYCFLIIYWHLSFFIHRPSVRIQGDKQLERKRKFYGGSGDKAHLGGFIELDIDGISPNLWRNMILEFGVHSVLDVGCGRGVSTRWFLEHHVDVLCVEGSHDAVEKTFLPTELVVEHDYNRGPWWPEKNLRCRVVHRIP